MIESTVDGQPSIWDSDNMPRVKNILTIEDDKMDGMNDENLEMRVDLAPSDAFENIEFLEDYRNQEESWGTSENNVDKNILKKGVRLFKKSTAPEIRPTIKEKRSLEITQQGNCEADKKEKLHEMRMAILRKELEINETRLLAAHPDVEIKQVQKEIEVTRLRNLLV